MVMFTSILVVLLYPVSSFFEVLGILKPFFKEGFKPPEARSFSMFLSRIRIIPNLCFFSKKIENTIAILVIPCYNQGGFPNFMQKG